MDAQAEPVEATAVPNGNGNGAAAPIPDMPAAVNGMSMPMAPLQPGQVMPPPVDLGDPSGMVTNGNGAMPHDGLAVSMAMPPAGADGAALDLSQQYAMGGGMAAAPGFDAAGGMVGQMGQMSLNGGGNGGADGSGMNGGMAGQQFAGAGAPGAAGAANQKTS